MTPLKPEVKTKWVKALRSGKYRQTSGALRDETGYCCLGVLCDVAVAEGVIPPPVLNTRHRRYDFKSTETSTMSCDGYPPSKVTEWAGLIDDGEEQYIEIQGNKNGFIHQNDTAKRSFDEIADAIETQL